MRKKIDLRSIPLTEVLPNDSEARKRISALSAVVSDQLKTVSETLATTDSSPITVGDIAILLGNLASAIATITPNKADDVAAAIARTIIKFAVK